MKENSRLVKISVLLDSDRVEALTHLAELNPPKTINCRHGRSATARRLLERAIDSLKTETPSEAA